MDTDRFNAMKGHLRVQPGDAPRHGPDPRDIDAARAANPTWFRRLLDRIRPNRSGGPGAR